MAVERWSKRSTLTEKQVVEHQMQMPDQNTWVGFSDTQRFQIMYGAKPEQISGPYIAEVISEQFDNYNRWRIGYGQLNAGGFSARLEHMRVGVEDNAEYFENFVYPAAREFERTVEAAQPFVEEDLRFIEYLGTSTRNEASTDIILNVWGEDEEDTLYENSISARQKNILRGQLTLKNTSQDR
jgi:hypothetical protein